MFMLRWRKTALSKTKVTVAMGPWRAWVLNVLVQGRAQARVPGVTPGAAEERPRGTSAIETFAQARLLPPFSRLPGYSW